ncbi:MULTISPECIES: hypothetical protein [unclassified Rhodococcus (in: high G+C Gram-positive bacteria)]|uniref:hypothetical protein n=1 Tax=unclassified Rhodococcus (in: high G+C Gram-positive bacteria) TaxID=192944 RepID=UPI001144541D|nr:MULTISPECIES: hypothetical protein [unclassified Rhodococcus (in: high G+C Gram-positive bacteria)]TQC34345.1 hypothetical protein EEB16_29625 [Rhodococcus sp. WS7]
MSSLPDQYRNRRSVAGVVPGILGIGLGAAGILAWRYATPLGTPEDPKIAGLAPVGPNGETGAIISYDGFIYQPDPEWFPFALVFPALGLLIALVVQFVMARFAWRFARHSRSSPVPLFTFLGLIGGLVGAATAWIGALHPPRLPAMIVTAGPIGGDPEAPTRLAIHFDVPAPYLTSTLTGIATGLVVALVLYLFGVRYERQTHAGKRNF